MVWLWEDDCGDVNKQSGCRTVMLILIYRLTEEQGQELGTVLTQVRS
jgi:hypothetical protein